MSLPDIPPMPKSGSGEDLLEWANGLRDYLLQERSSSGQTTPVTPQLRHKIGGESAAQNGLMIWEPTNKQPQVSVDGAWETVTVASDLGTIASQDADSVTITGGSISDLSSLSVRGASPLRSTYNTGADDFVIDTGGANTGITVAGSTTSNLYFADAADDNAGAFQFNHGTDLLQVYIDGNYQYAFDGSGSLNRTDSVATRANGDARWLLESNNLSDLDNASTARSNLGLEIGVDIPAFEDILCGSSATATSVTSGKTGGTSYQNTNGNMIMVVITCKSSDGSTGFFQLSSDDSTWLNIAPFPASSGSAVTCSYIVPDDWYYRTSRAVDTATDRWVEIK